MKPALCFAKQMKVVEAQSKGMGSLKHTPLVLCVSLSDSSHKKIYYFQYTKINKYFPTN